MRQFNTTGTCFPHLHYMVDISRQVNYAADMVRDNKYFCINRGRQFGKTTTLSILQEKLEKDGYAVFSMSFEGLSDKDFESLDSVCAMFFKMMKEQVDDEYVANCPEPLVSAFANYPQITDQQQFNNAIKVICTECPKIVIIIDEVDQAGNYDSFIKFLGLLRSRYLVRVKKSTFLSVILAGVYDVKNLNLKLSPESDHQYNSPWNIASPFDADMSLPADGIAKMLSEYKADHNIDFDENSVAQNIYDWTSGYPYLVSRICQLLDSKNYGWDFHGVNEAVKYILQDSSDVLLGDFAKKLDDFHELKESLRMILFEGYNIPYSPMEKGLNLARLFNFIKLEGSVVKPFNRFFETALYDLFFIESKFETLYSTGLRDMNQFVKDGALNMKLIMEKFATHFRDIYGDRDERFIEKEGRKFFMLYLRPIINGAGNYYIEAETRDFTRTDIIIYYMARQYVVEIKIWNGDEYNRKGEIQLSEYLDYYHLDEGYMLSFCFNKNKIPGPEDVTFGSKILHEVIV